MEKYHQAEHIKAYLAYSKTTANQQIFLSGKIEAYNELKDIIEELKKEMEK